MRNALSFLLAACLAAAETTSGPAITLTAGRGELIQFRQDIVRVVVAEPKIADAVVVSPREVMVNAKAPGHTTVIVWEGTLDPTRYEVTVTPDLMETQTQRRILDTELKALSGANVAYTWNGESIVLTGTAPVEVAKQANALAATHAKSVVNLIQTPPAPEPRQIMLQVKFATIDRVSLAALGFNLFSANGKTLGGVTTQQFSSPRISQLQFQGGNLQNNTLNFSDLLNLFVFRPDLNIGATIQAMAQRNLLQILAEPNLIVVEGKEASFLAGGEFPFPTVTTTPTGGALAPVVTVQFKKFGVQLDFSPTVTHNGAINLKVSPEVSSLDFANAVTIQGFTIPAIATRRAETEVLLKDGESFAIAGLIDNRVEQQLSRIRGIGDVPILGKLFQSRQTKKSTDELLVVVTPRFVKPLSPEERAKLPDTVETFLPTVKEEQSAIDAKKKAKKSKAPKFVGQRGQQEPN
ncbi:MAG: pilus assembly protein N-terminal domain-containing protein [Acidobacteria bacterium]|nr:pilus assembly protein N-terminal domain-containing protein [Acidobacteriota bacterium]